MANTKITRKAIIAGILSIALCASMLLGTTLAWFTDTASTGVVSIQSGKLDITLTDNDGNSVEGGRIGFVDENGELLSNIIWEPGARYTLQTVKLVNRGNLAAKYRVYINASTGDVDLASVIDVYEGDTRIGTLRELIDLEGGVKNGVIAPEESLAFGTLTLVMHPTAGNAYQGLALDSISITVVATQASSESDSFDNTYDNDATLPIIIYNGDGFLDAVGNIKDGGTIYIANNMTVAGPEYTNGDLTHTGKVTNVDLGGNTVIGDNKNITFRVRGNSTATFSNGTITAALGTYSAISASGNADGIAGKAILNVTNMVLNNSTQNGNAIKAFASSVINVEATTVNSTFGGGAEATGGVINIKNSTFTQKENGGDANSMNVAASNGGVANIYSGTFESENYCLYIFRSGGTMNVHGGSFKGATVLMADSYVTEPDCIFNIYGGTFDGAIAISNGSELNIFAGTFKNTGLTAEQFAQYVDANSVVTESNGIFTVVAK